ncbi:MAG: hypothetical protein NZ520_11995, partial [bacterium]|nr:hypothetical protein [bacterium]
SPITQSVPVRNGLFTVELNFGTVWDGADRWLQIQINTTPPTVLSPRIKINPTPYASFAFRPWITSGSNIFYTAGNVGIGTNSPAYPLHVISTAGITPVIHAESATAHTVIQGVSLDTSGQRWGVRGESRSPEGAGVTGFNGVAGGIGVFGQVSNPNGSGIGVWGLTYGEFGIGVAGESRSTTGVSHGVRGQNSSTSGDSAGVLGVARAA